jgi:hypothetical protein
MGKGVFYEGCVFLYKQLNPLIMKNSLFVLLISLALFLTSCAGSSDSAGMEDASNSSSTQNTSGNTKLPDAVVQIKTTQDGNLLEELNFTLKGQHATTQAATCGYQKAMGLFTLMANGNLTGADSKLSISGKIPELEKKKYDIKTLDPEMKNLFCSYVSKSGVPYTSTSGTFEITKLDLYQDTGIGAATYFMDATIQIEFVSQMDASQTITVNGTLKGINTAVR